MRRREFIAGLGGVAGGGAGARIPRIGIIDDAQLWYNFRRASREQDYLEGQNIAFEYRVTNSLQPQ
jgi:hypothetical protein